MGWCSWKVCKAMWQSKTLLISFKDVFSDSVFSHFWKSTLWPQHRLWQALSCWALLRLSVLGADLMWQEMLKVRAETREEGCSGLGVRTQEGWSLGQSCKFLSLWGLWWIQAPRPVGSKGMRAYLLELTPGSFPLSFISASIHAHVMHIPILCIVQLPGQWELFQPQLLSLI